jgi:hypothetical protein
MYLEPSACKKLCTSEYFKPASQSIPVRTFLKNWPSFQRVSSLAHKVFCKQKSSSQEKIRINQNPPLLKAKGTRSIRSLRNAFVVPESLLQAGVFCTTKNLVPTT